MDKCYILEFDQSMAAQSAVDDAFIGGVPKVPESLLLPDCSLCGNKQSFFFQVAFPVGHVWEGLSLATFACTSCANRNHLIPKMLPGPLHGVTIPTNLLSEYQTNFRFIIFETIIGVVRKDYVPRVKFKRIHLKATKNSTVNKNKVGGTPNWPLEDETPGKYGSEEMFFLLQLKQGMQFPIESNAPKQIELGLSREPQVSPLDYYQLFISNNIYMFGTAGRATPNVYVLTQI